MVLLEKSYTYEELEALMKELAEAYPGILKLEPLGASYDGRTIYGFRLGKAEKCLICTAGIHGRESVNPILLLRMLEVYSQALEHGKSILFGYPIRELFRSFSLYFIPLLNPDGYQIARFGYEQLQDPMLRHAMKLKEIPSQLWKYNGRGVDINRNFPSASYALSPSAGRAGSERETQILMETFQRLKYSVGYLDFHSRGKILYYYRKAMPYSYNRRGKKMAKRLQEITDYDLGSRREEFATAYSGGNSVNYYSEVYRRLAITVETVEEEAGFPMETEYQLRTYPEIVELPLAYLTEYQVGDYPF